MLRLTLRHVSLFADATPADAQWRVWERRGQRAYVNGVRVPLRAFHALRSRTSRRTLIGSHRVVQR